MAVIIILCFLGCLITGYVLGISKDDDSKTKFLSWFLTLLMLGLSITCLFGWREVYKEQVLQKHYNIIQEETITTTYKIIPNGSI